MVVAAAEHAHDDLPATAEWRSSDHGLAVHRDYQGNSGYHDCRDQEAHHRTCIRTSTLLNSTAIVASIPPGDKHRAEQRGQQRSAAQRSSVSLRLAAQPSGDRSQPCSAVILRYSGTRAAARALLSLAASARVGRREATLPTVTTE
jgi:hypothetical protein